VQSGEVGGHQRLHRLHGVCPVGAVDKPLGPAARPAAALALDLVQVVQHPLVQQTIEQENAEQPSVAHVPPALAAITLPLF